MDDRKAIGAQLDARRRDEWTGINFLLGEMDGLRERGLVLDDAHRTIVDEYSARRDGLELEVRYDQAMARARGAAVVSPREAIVWAARACEIRPDRPEPYHLGIELLRKAGRFEEASQLVERATARFPDRTFTPSKPMPIASKQPAGQPLDRVEKYFQERNESVANPGPTVSWSSIAGELLQEHWQKLISALAVLLIVVSSTVGASLVLGPLLWSPVGKVVLAAAFTTVSAGFGLGLARWGAERAGRVMLATSLILIPINFMLVGGLGLMVAPSLFEVVLVAVDAALLLALARGVVGRLGLPTPVAFTTSFFLLALLNAGASTGMTAEAGLAIFLVPGVAFLAGIAWMNRRIGTEAEPAYLAAGVLAFGFLSGVVRTGVVVLQLGPPWYAIPAMLTAITAVSTARAVSTIEKDRRTSLLVHQAGLTFSALAFALVLTRPPGVSALYSGNTLAVAMLGLALYATSLRATRLPAYLYCGFAALVVAYFGVFYFVSDLAHAVEEVARQAMGYQSKLPRPFKAINGLVFNLGLAWLAGFFAKRWSDDRLARHCHFIGLPLSIAACVFSGFEPKSGLICLSGYAALYSLGIWWFARPNLAYLACAATVGAAFFGSGLAGASSFEARALIFSLLSLVFWSVTMLPGLRHANAWYRIPWSMSARAMAVIALATATIASGWNGIIAPEATVAFLLVGALGLLDGRELRSPGTYLLAIVGLLGAWLGGVHLAFGAAPTLATHALAVGGFALPLLLAGELARGRLGETGSTGAYLRAVGWSVPVLALSGWIIAGWPLVDSVTVARAFLVGSAALLWLTRFRRETWLVSIGLMGLAIWTGCLTGLMVPGGWGTGRLESWLALTLATVSLAYWGLGEWGRRRDSDFYAWPCLGLATSLALIASVLAVVGRYPSANLYRIEMAAMLVSSVSLGLVASSTRWTGAVALATGAAVGSTYLFLFSQGPADPSKAWVLAMAAAVESIACRGVAWLVRRGTRNTDDRMALPLDIWAFVLLVGATLLGNGSPVTLLAIAAASVLMIGAFPWTGWLYGTSAALWGAAYLGWLAPRYSGDGLVIFVVVGAYLWWGLAVVIQRYGPMILERLGLPDLGLHAPLAKVAVVLALVTASLRAREIITFGGTRWAELGWLPWALAGFCLLMPRVESWRGWAHLAIGLTGFGYAAIVAPWADSLSWWLATSMSLACGWSLAGWTLRRFGPWLRGRFGMAEIEDAGALRSWSQGAAVLSGVGLVVTVSVTTLLPIVVPVVNWPEVTVALGLAALYVGLEGRRAGRDLFQVALESVGLLVIWWAAAPGSPLINGTGPNVDPYLIIATAAYALLVVGLGIWAERRPIAGVIDGSEASFPVDRSLLIKSTSRGAFALAFGASLFSFGRIDVVTVTTLLLGVATFGWLALAWNRLESAIAGGIAWILAWPVGWEVVLKGSLDPRAITASSSVAMIIGLATLWIAAGWVRRREPGKGGDLVGQARVASALECVAIAFTSVTILVSLTSSDPTGWIGASVLLALAGFYVAVSWRWKAEWPAYAVQLLLLGCYFRLRPTLGVSGVADAAILATLAYVDLGFSELLDRLRKPLFARPTLRFALVLPIVPILEGLWMNHRDGGGLFTLLATSGFYALVALRMRNKIPGYVACALMNASLWLAWDLMGWRLADSPQFYLIPVGFTTILLGEVNREELGRSTVNGLRNLGLGLIYASLAAPIWQAQSFGAWLTLLLLSLVGVFVGIGLRVQSFLWMGLTSFVLVVTYQLARLGVEHALARWGVMLALGVGLILFVALNEKRRIVETMREYYEKARTWE